MTISVSNLARSIQNRQTSALEVISQTLAAIEAKNRHLNCFTDILHPRALAQAQKIDQAIANGEPVGVLAGVPFAVKNLFDIKGIVTLAGSKINRDHPAAGQDAIAIQTLEAAGAVLVGATNMDEYAYGFVTENAHYGATPNPLDPSRISGGSSGGSAAAVAANLVPLALGSDTNGSVRVPAACCGVVGLKPTFGRVSRQGLFWFVSSLDHPGFFSGNVADMAAIWGLFAKNNLKAPLSGLEDVKIALADDYFQQGAEPEVFEAVTAIAERFGVTKKITIPETARARAAAYIITAAEGANWHLPRLQTRLEDFDPATRDRFLAGALIPSSWYLQAQRFRRWYRDRLREIFTEVDIILTPTIPCIAPPLGVEKMIIDGQELLIRPNLGRFTQPFSFIGLPALSLPIKRPSQLPLGLQIIAAPDREDLILRVARVLEEMLA
ncbi:MAG: AtzE family amidohydrolase [Microcystis wesenbergii Mw_QC_S_20081001_S30D]|jgi:aspartyl-tRNA(Asn)/glutamyl-tRNA(Gln) amidotransferase subunit A|uniref:AtzE family amidohydrolase n=1 Tax=Microcystis wesenbergii Mw_QC_S_20081001_S30D TaxID=2486245 RepID=A0A552JZH9_9CHRO|nr:AtzE family amidohydrolase [Microcystis aeruginosa W11-03]NCR93391.1 AtzE family amidohydrolase [Microcystis aeruginosa W11-06]TRU95226.1 MAG: AtzE family amidohydrolase [Microcystis wesenbergii Mw_QC_B_20070930_S4D]TRU98977.1 MAG: AtzE family amidohydrolase [Microcystis wesenbergii Mw_QC_S_20081001_S30]TRV01162.1 MAG: AtzE family amidohydrolase [Microcystis wesenbergii Mw_QC_S_20081001_S30D]TRV12012.1 MAG: AtzE family amidohydrolase [Microcystis wesenbergii Mw_QC_B_20070930_S4]